MEQNDKEKLKGNLLRLIITRIDYEDILKVSSETLKEIKEMFPECNVVSRMLKDNDFNFDDPKGVVDLPEEVIEKSSSTAFALKDTRMVIEVNQYFVRILYEVDKEKYNKYEDVIQNKVIDVMNIMNKKENIQLKRISILKMDEVFFNSLGKMKKIFKSNILRMNLFDGNISWSEPSTQIATINNFKYDECYVNFKTNFSRVKIDKIYMRLLLSYEAYMKNDISVENLKDILEDLNLCCYNLFVKSLTPTGFEKLKKGEVIGDYEIK